MILSISPPLAHVHLERLWQFCEVHHYRGSNCKMFTDLSPLAVKLPSIYCTWKPTQDGRFLCAPDTAVTREQPFLKWLILLIQSFFSPLNYCLDGLVLLNNYHCVVKENVLVIYKDGTCMLLKWRPARTIDDLHDTWMNLVGDILVLCGIGDWKLDRSTIIATNGTIIDSKTRTVYIEKSRLVKYSQTMGMKNLLRYIYFSMSPFRERASLSNFVTPRLKQIT
jgi:hypothetical protein